MDKLAAELFIKKHEGYIGSKIVASGLNITPIKSLTIGRVKIKGKFGKINTVKSSKKPFLLIYESFISDSTGSIRTVWFNSPRVKNFIENEHYIFLGEVSLYKGVMTLQNPLFATLKEMSKWEIIFKQEMQSP